MKKVRLFGIPTVSGFSASGKPSIGQILDFFLKRTEFFLRKIRDYYVLPQITVDEKRNLKYNGFTYMTTLIANE